MQRKRVAKFQGVYVRVSKHKKLASGKPDKCFDITYKTTAGKKVWEKVGWASNGVTAQYAAQIRNQRLLQIQNGGANEDEIQQKKKTGLIFSEFFEKEYLPWSEANKVSANREAALYRLWIKPFIGDARMSKVGPADLERMKNRVLKGGRSQRTARYVLEVVRQTYNKAKVWGHYDGNNPATGVRLPRPDNRRLRFLTVDEVNRLLAELQRSSNIAYQMSLLSVHTGMRAGEIFNLKWRDINFDTGTMILRNTKNGDTRHAYLTDEIEAMLRDRLHPGAVRPNERVFRDRNGGKIIAVTDAFERTVKRIGLNEGVTDRRDKVVFHTLRHTFASWLAIQGTPLNTIKELMGHKTLTMTERYAHLIPDVKREAVRDLASRFAKKRKPK
jgi:integrase